MGDYGCNMDFFFFDLKIEIYYTRTHYLEKAEEIQTSAKWRKNSLASLGQMAQYGLKS